MTIDDYAAAAAQPLVVGDRFVVDGDERNPHSVAHVVAVGDDATDEMLGAGGEKYHVQVVAYTSAEELTAAAVDLERRSLDGCFVVRVVPPVQPHQARRSERERKKPRLSIPSPSSSAAGTGGALSARRARGSLLDRDVDNASAFDVTGISVGDRLLALGFAPSGQQEWFQAEVIALRSSWPPIVVKFTATEAGETLPLTRPRPLKAYVPKAATKALP